MILHVQRATPIGATTPGQLSIDWIYFCETLEDMIRERPGVNVAEWKIKHETAVPAGIYELELVNSPKFGIDTISLINVPGFDDVRIHSGVNMYSTDGCLIVGDTIHQTDPISISGGLNQHVLERLKAIVVPLIKGGVKCELEISNPPGWQP